MPKTTENDNMIAKLRILAIVVILLAGGGAAYWYFNVSHVHSDGQIRVSGNIETTEAQVAFKIAGRVEKRLFDEGEMVKQGQLVAELDTADLQCNVDRASSRGADRQGGVGRVAGRVAAGGQATRPRRPGRRRPTPWPTWRPARGRRRLRRPRRPWPRPTPT